MTERTDLLGIDLGTSSVKVLLRHADGRIEKARSAYRCETPEAFWDAVCEALSTLSLSGVSAVGLSSQTGTYIVNGQDVIGWRDGAGREELESVRAAYEREVFLREIAMPHPALNSYPIPRLLYIKKHFADVRTVCQPKDFLLSRLTGVCASDPYTWRGLANPKTGQYSAFFLSELGMDASVLPPLLPPTAVGGYVTEEAALLTGLPVGTPVMLGMNDFFASIVGMGIVDGGAFDITGTSEHFGVVGASLSEDTPLVSSPYLEGFVTYGVTASSGVSLDFMRDTLSDPLTGMTDDPVAYLGQKPPIFLPYLSGERAPIFDAEAKGVFFGITQGCTREALAYAVCEGVAFSLYHISESMGAPTRIGVPVTVSGGASRLGLLTKIKAELFGTEFVTLEENDTSALGAAMAAGVGCGAFGSLKDAARQCCRAGKRFLPTGECRTVLLRRYEIYKALYPSLKAEMHAFSDAENGKGQQ